MIQDLRFYLIIFVLCQEQYYPVNAHSAKDGNWGPWSNLSHCSTTCNDGVQTRNRTCDDPPPSHGGADCPGSNYEILPCNEGSCTNFTGTWGAWSNYSSCSVSCGIGFKFRNRTCEKIDANDTMVATCDGFASVMATCDQGICPPINGSWSSWSNYGTCSVTCGGGTQSKMRSCDNPAPQNGGLHCKGPHFLSRACNEDGCPGFDNKGRKFIFGFMRNDAFYFGKLKLFLTTDYVQNVTVTITTPLYDSGFFQNITVSKGKVESVEISEKLFSMTGIIEKKGILIEAERDIVVYAVNKAMYSSDAMVVLPVDAIGQEYYVTSWEHSSSFLIVGTEDYTDVSIKFGKHSSDIIYKGQTYRPQLETLKLTMNSFETLYLENYGDFTGTHVFGTKPITLIAGNPCISIGQGACDHIFQQILPIDKLGRDFVTVGMPNCGVQDTFRIVSSQSNTVVNISGRPSVTLNDPGDVYTFILPDGDSRTVSSNKGIQLTLFANGGCDTLSKGDPAMVILPAIQQFSSNYIFSTVKLDGNDFINSLSLAIAEVFISGLRLDGSLLPNSTWKSVVGRNDIKYTDFIIPSGPHSVYHEDPSVTFLAVSTGIQEFNSYGYPIGFDFQRTIEKCNNFTTNTSATVKSACSVNLDPCAGQQCLNNGTCNPQGWTNYDCSCPATYGGQRCEIDLCQFHPSDVLFLMDDSQSMGSFFFDIQKRFIIDMISNWTLDSEHFEVAVMLFSKTSSHKYNFGDLTNKTDFEEKLSNLTFQGGISNIHTGLTDATRIMKNRTRTVHFVPVKKYIILFSDGLQSSPKDISTFTDTDITLHIVAVGQDVSHFFLNKISGSFSNVFHPFNNRLQSHMTSELIHPLCGVCHSSSETDVIFLVDRSASLKEDDVRTHIPEVLETLLNKMENTFINTRLSLITFSDNIDIRFRLMEYTNKTKPIMHRHVHSFSRAQEKVSNFTKILSNVNSLFNDSTHGARPTAKKILLIISNFSFNVNKNVTQVFNNALEVYTVGLDDGSFDKMLFLTPSPYNVGIVGNFFASQIETFFDALIEHFLHINCTN